ncbi:MAG: hypothetical protein K1X44_04025 [Alphaproteobacteria bacterium]|nr:hypothetical protein [Alphaproteobacteria bacterium]
MKKYLLYSNANKRNLLNSELYLSENSRPINYDTSTLLSRFDGTWDDDTLVGKYDDENQIFGYGGDDFLVGGSLSDTLYGGVGQDTLVGLMGDDILEGGFGPDSLWGYGGTDTASYKNSIGVNVDLLSGKGRGGDAEGDILNDIENVDGSLGNDNLTGNYGNNKLNGYNGNDILDGLAGDDILNGGDGDDTLDKWGGRDGDDILNGGNGNDDITFGNGNDTVYGGTGDDNIIASLMGRSQSFVDGGDGTDMLSVYYLILSDYQFKSVSFNEFVSINKTTGDTNRYLNFEYVNTSAAKMTVADFLSKYGSFSTQTDPSSLTQSINAFETNDGQPDNSLSTIADSKDQSGFLVGSTI